ncbi:hypothetical protein F4821DRAFT_229598 [Hypoxylon rubiginosum]|uniref:Uncharacterized protein n=1 Tax=Hypoxylon rubiginosum TaxID=110542 RepID=A0ACC0DC02_9PEZI|nr:hypothetical protein F4821DRAFT_229598 [Hypoxylon rubiginosum]
MGPIKTALSLIPSFRHSGSRIAYEELPSHDMSHASSPLDESPIMSDSWRKGISAPRRRLGLLLRTSPRRLCLVTLAVFFTLVLIAGGSFRARRYYKEKDKPDERIPYHWELYPRLNGFYNGVRSLVSYSDWVPEQQDTSNTKIQIHKAPPFDPVSVNPYPDYGSDEYLEDHYPVQRCYVDDNEVYPAPDVFAYPGIPAGMTAPFWGSYESIGTAPDRCWERFGRFGPYGYSYNPSEGGLGLANKTAHAGADKIEDMFTKVDYRDVNWGKAQKTCLEKNRKRFNPKAVVGDNDSATGQKKAVKRSAYVLRTWTGYKYTDIQLLSLRAMINELSLKSGGEYDVHLLVHVKDDKIPIWASEEVYNETLRANVPEEFWGITTLWSEQLMRLYYPGPFRDEDNLENHSKSDIYGVYRSAHFALQWFAQQHQEYEFFWNWEMDIRYTGHYYEFHNGVSNWAAEQPRKLLWERSSRFWIPGIHGSWAKFSQHVERETIERNEKPIWGPVEFPTNGLGRLASPNETTPPTTIEEDDYQWGVGEDADLIVFDPLFDPANTNWVFRNDVTGYNTSLETPPRRAAIITVGRLSRRLLNTMHEETYRKHHTMFPEMWPPTVALHHGYKAVYAPHPVYFDRKWPLDVMDKTFNYPTAPQESPFGWGEHNMQGGTFYYNAGFSGALWRRWLGAKENGEGGKKMEESRSDRMCLRGMLYHPIKVESMEN